jgi:hypothetical protein
MEDDDNLRPLRCGTRFDRRLVSYSLYTPVSLFFRLLSYGAGSGAYQGISWQQNSSMKTRTFLPALYVRMYDAKQDK